VGGKKLIPPLPFVKTLILAGGGRLAPSLPPSIPPSSSSSTSQVLNGREGGSGGEGEQEVLVLSSVGCENIIVNDKALQAYFRERGREGRKVVWATEMLLDFLTKEGWEEGREGGIKEGKYVLWEEAGGKETSKEKLKLAWPRRAVAAMQAEEKEEGRRCSDDCTQQDSGTTAKSEK